jgi:hypothetical protein
MPLYGFAVSSENRGQGETPRRSIFTEASGLQQSLDLRHQVFEGR